MPGFYKHDGDKTHWKSFTEISGLEMTFNDVDIVLKAKNDVVKEGCLDVNFEASTCTPVNGRKYGQICAKGYSSRDTDNV